MYNLVLLLPLVAFLQAFLGGFFFGRQLSSILSVTLLGLTAMVSWFIFFEVALSQVTVVYPLYS